jgi:hypothetical protein
MVVFLALLVVAVALWVRARRGGDAVTLGRHGEVVLVSSCDGVRVELYRGRPDAGRAWGWVRGDEALPGLASLATGHPMRRVGARSRGWRGFEAGSADLVCEAVRGPVARPVVRRWVGMPHWYAVSVAGVLSVVMGAAVLRRRR